MGVLPERNGSLKKHCAGKGQSVKSSGRRTEYVPRKGNARVEKTGE